MWSQQPASIRMSQYFHILKPVSRPKVYHIAKEKKSFTQSQQEVEGWREPQRTVTQIDLSLLHQVLTLVAVAKNRVSK